MSIALMTAAFRAELPTTPKFVLVALCDSANDQGECYPSVTALMAKCSLSDRGVQRAIAALEADGYVSREFRKGRSTVYWITPTPDTRSPRSRPTVTPERPSPPTDVHPTPDTQSPPPPNVGHPTPERPSPITVKEPSVEPSLKRERRTKARPASDEVPVSVLVDAGFDTHTAAEFIATKAERKAPLTARAWVDHQREAAKAGWSVQAAAEKVMGKTWKGFEAKYVADERPPQRAAPQVASFRERDQQAAREKVAAFTGGLAAAPDPTHRRSGEVIDMEDAHAPRRLG